MKVYKTSLARTYKHVIITKRNLFIEPYQDRYDQLKARKKPTFSHNTYEGTETQLMELQDMHTPVETDLGKQLA